MMKTPAIVLALAASARASLPCGGECEWAGSFKVKAYDTVEWVAQKVDGDYGEAGRRPPSLPTHSFPPQFH